MTIIILSCSVFLLAIAVFIQGWRISMVQKLLQGRIDYLERRTQRPPMAGEEQWRDQ